MSMSASERVPGRCRADLRISEGHVSVFSPDLPDFRESAVFHYKNYTLFPGLVDVHVHLREPGFSYKETIATGTRAAARGGFTAVCAMPNLSPVPDSPENLEAELALIRRGAAVAVFPYGSLTRGESGEELSDMEAMAPHVAGFSDDGRGVQRIELMRAAMQKAAALGKIIAAHCEDERFLHGGVIHDGAYARLYNLPGISSESEWRQVERDIDLVRETGCRYHVCHVSTKESVALLRAAKAEGLPVSCETAPHYLLLSDAKLQDAGRFRMNPPIRSKADQLALIEALQDGTIDILATDHAPHAALEKAGGLRKSLMGVVGLEIAFPVLYTGLVQPGIITLEKLIECMSTAPRSRFGLPGGMENGDFTVFDLDASYTVDPAEFLSMGRATPFEGREVFGRCLLTVHKGRIVWQAKEMELPI
jgi:dihydroorotase